MIKNIDYKHEEFYETYSEFREYISPRIGKKELRQFRQNYWKNCEFFRDMTVLEVGCGTGLFLKYLEEEGVQEFFGVDNDPKVKEVLSGNIFDRVEIFDIIDYLDYIPKNRNFDRIILIDVLEHFNPSQGAVLLRKLSERLNKFGAIVVKVPNNGSPWGAGYQFGDLTHQSAYNSFSLRQLGIKIGMNCRVFSYRRGNPRKQIIENFFHAAVELFLTERPEFWSANIIGYFTTRTSD
ncbi:MAG: class I SAM-dependent methyltransferase [Pseudomonadota bacterium]|nr:class I SAM-dependent methyltransferase [Pseudomonadota bacterium]